MEGLWIPKEILQLGGATHTEMFILSVYHYYTVNGDKHCCTLTNKQVAEITLTGERTVQRCKAKYKKLLHISGNITKWFPAKVEDINNLLKDDRLDDAITMLCKCISAGLLEDATRVKYFNKLLAYINDTYYGDKHIQIYKDFNERYDDVIRKVKKVNNAWGDTDGRVG